MRIDTTNRLIKLGDAQTDTLRFITPILLEYELTGDHIVTDNFKGAYLGTESDEEGELPNRLLLRYSPDKSDDFKSLDEKITSLPIALRDYDLKDDIVYVLDIENGSKLKLIENFYYGRYSQFDDKYKEDIIKFWGLEDDNGEDHITGILYKTEKGEQAYNEFFTEEMKENTADNELWPVPNMEHESL